MNQITQFFQKLDQKLTPVEPFINRLLSNTILLLVATLLFFICLLPGVLFTLYKAIKQRSLVKTLAYLANTELTAALVIDILGNVVCRDLLSATLVYGDDAYPFGSYKETISRVLGKNKALSRLTKTGTWLANTLNRIDRVPNHVERAAADN